MANDKYPYMSVNGEFFDKEFLDSVWKYLHDRTPLWSTGLEVPSPSDKFAYQVLKQITVYRKHDDRPSDSD